MPSKLKLIFVVLGTLIGVLITSQFLTSVPVNSNFPVDQLQSREELLSDLNKEQNALQSRIVLLRDKIDKINRENTQEQGLISNLNRLKASVGLEAQTGPGIEISLNDGDESLRNTDETISSYLIHAADLRDIINAMRAADATAISVNNQRILSSTSIISVGNTILINNVNVAPPYTINVVGEPEKLLRYIQDDQVLEDLKKRISVGQIEMNIGDKRFVTVPIFNGSFRTKYINEN